MGDKQLYDVLMHPQQYTSKKRAQEDTGAIKNSILRYPRSMTVDEIAEACVAGHVISFCHAESNTGTSKNSFTADCWRYQQIYALDIDNTDKNHKKFTRPYYMKYGEAIKHVKKQGFAPAFVYTTGSHTNAFQKYRMAFVLDMPVTSILDHHKVQKAFMAMMSIDGRTLLDSSCIEPSRVFYPGKELVYQNSGAVVSVEELLNKYPYNTSKELKSVSEDITIAQTEDIPELNDTIQQIVGEIRQKQNMRRMQPNTRRSLVTKGLKRCTPKCESKYNNIMFTSTFLQNPVNPCHIRVPEDFDAFCFQVPLEKLLDLPFEKNFRCILPGHEDKAPSARITWNNDRYLYRCFGCGKTYDIFGLLEELSGCNRHSVMDWICEAFNIDYETDWQRIQKEEILQYHDYMVQNLSTDYPILYKKIAAKNSSGILNMFLDIARMRMLDRAWAGTNKSIFYYSLHSFAKKGEYYGVNTKITSIHRSLVYLAHLGLIEILKDKDIPLRMKSLLHRIQEQSEHKSRISCYSVPKLSHELLSRAQNIVEEDKKTSFRKSFLCREQLLRAGGEINAGQVYVQAEDTPVNQEAECFYQKYQSAAKNLLEKQGWTTEKQIIDRVKSKFKVGKTLKTFSKQKKAWLSGICMPQLLRELNLQRVPFSKEIEKEYAIKSRKKLYYGASKVIIPVDSEQ